MKRMILALAFVLSGCAGPQAWPPAMPSVAAILAQQAAISAVSPNNVPAFFASGLSLIELQCGGYFDNAVMAALQQAQRQGQANALGGALLAALGLGGVGGAPVSGVGLGLTTLNQMLGVNAQNSLAGSDPAITYNLVQAAQEKLIAAGGMPVTPAAAYQALVDVSRQCAPAGIQQLKEMALIAAPNHMVVTPVPPPVSLRGGRAVPVRPTGPHHVVVR